MKKLLCCSANSILSALRKPSEPLQMKLLFTFSVPILTYAAEIKQFSHIDMHSCTVALNDSIRKIFSFHRWESIRSLRLELGYPDLITIFALKRRKFFSQMRLTNNQTLLTFLSHWIDCILISLVFERCYCVHPVIIWRIRRSFIWCQSRFVPFFSQKSSFNLFAVVATHFLQLD